MYPKDYNPNVFVSCPGERYKTEYIGEPDEDGVIQLVPVGKIDLVELHNRDADMNDVNLLYQRFCNGDITALSRRQGSFMDALGLPRDLRGMYDMVENFRTAYNNLDPEKRDKYSFEEFIDKAGSEQWIKDFVKNTAESPSASFAANSQAESAPKEPVS